MKNKGITLLLGGMLGLTMLAVALPFQSGSTVIAAKAQAMEKIERQEKMLVGMKAYESIEKNDRLIRLTNAHITRKMDENLSIENIKALTDFDGNSYTVFELAPTGYIIYHSDSGKYVEYASDSPSPYLGHDGELYYGGLVQYYYRDGDTLRHTLEGSREIPVSEAPDYAECSREIADNLIADVEAEHLAYIDGKMSLSTITRSAVSMQSIVEYKNTPRITMVRFFSNLRESNRIGYHSGGACGYISSNLIIGYNYFAYDYGLITNTSYVNLSSMCMNGDGLTKYLIDLDGAVKNSDNEYPGTTAKDAKNYVGKYLKEVHNTKTWHYQWKLFKIDAQSILKKGHPVALYGKFVNPKTEKKINHAVTAYDYIDGHYIVHFGWSEDYPYIYNYACVSTDGGVIGENFGMYIVD